MARGGPESSAALVEDLVAANRILARYGVLDAFGHVSVRSDRRPDRYLLSRSLAPELVRAKDIVEYDLDSNPIRARAPRPYLERYIHGEIYRARPDVSAVVHSHSLSVVPFAASTERLRPIYHMAGFLGRGTPVFDIRERFGETDLLVRNADHGRALSERLGAAHVALMRGHGFVAAGPDVPQAVYYAIYTELNARLQRDVIAIGGRVRFLSDEEAKLAEATNRAVIDRPWQLWKKQALGEK